MARKQYDDGIDPDTMLPGQRTEMDAFLQDEVGMMPDDEGDIWNYGEFTPPVLGNEED